MRRLKIRPNFGSYPASLIAASKLTMKEIVGERSGASASNTGSSKTTLTARF